jgi:uncharacterized membrane protein
MSNFVFLQEDQTRNSSGGPQLSEPLTVPYKQPKSYLIISILNTFFCSSCICLGILAIIFSVKTREANKYGNHIDAEKYSKKARNFNILAFLLGICFFIIYIILTIVKAYFTIQEQYYGNSSTDRPSYMNAEN